MTSVALEKPPSSKYVKEIEGLRAVAVISVLLFHLGLAEVPGGFVGVDVFFVISGYLITGILFAGLGGGGLSLSTFYARRVLRIAPALFATLVVTASVFFFVLPPQFTENLRASFFAALLSYSNIWFFFTVDYFTDQSTNPLLHTWSLAVEEQFYLVFPLLLLAIHRLALTRFKLHIIAALALLSFVASCIVVQSGRSEAFYFPWLRAWELLAGGLLAGLRLDRISTLVKSVLSDGGLALILISCFMFTDTMVFPGYSALVPVLGAAAIISGVNGRGASNYLLSAPPVTFIGKISYSLYLVHWPMICLSQIVTGWAGSKTKVAILIAIVVLSWASWRFVETPFRRLTRIIPPRAVLLRFTAAVAIMLAAITTFQFAGSRFWDRADLNAYLNAVIADRSYFRYGSCLVNERSGLASFMAGDCLRQSDVKPNILLLGDSHAANLWSALTNRYAEYNFLQANGVGCKPLLSTSGAQKCVDLNRYIFDEWLSADGKKIEYVMLAAQWVASDVEGLKATIAYLNSQGKKVFLYGPSPEYFISPPLMMAYERLLNLDLQSRFIKAERRDLDSIFKMEFSSSTNYFSPIDAFCSNKCILLSKGEPTMFDRDHFTREGAALMVSKISFSRLPYIEQIR